MRNFLWFDLDGFDDTRARVAWQTIILRQAEGSLGIIDPELQSQALLGNHPRFDPGGANVEAVTSAGDQLLYPAPRRRVDAFF